MRLLTISKLFMRTLVVTLPKSLAAAGAGTFYDYLLTSDGETVQKHGRALLADLPRSAKSQMETVAVVPTVALSWHRVTLPLGFTSKSPRLRAMLEGALEERFLDDPEAVHFALAPDARAGIPTWVAVCNKAWLGQTIEALELANCPVGRIVPEFHPGSARDEWHAVSTPGTPDGARLVVTTSQGVALLPLTGTSLEFAGACAKFDAATEVFADAEVADLAKELLSCQVSTQTSQERLLQAIKSPWDLAQFEMANSTHSRSFKRITEGLGVLAFGRVWRTTRWSVALLIAVNVVGLNAWAWKEQSLMNSKRLAMREILSRSFPKVNVIVDPPIQMERELASLKQSAGVPSRRDLEPILGLLSTALAAGHTASALHFSSNEMKVKDLNLSSAEVQYLTEKMSAQGYELHHEDNLLVIKESPQK